MTKKLKASDCQFGFVQSDEKGSALGQRDACRHCGRTKRWHDEQNAPSAVLVEQILPSDIQAEEFLTLAGYKNSSFYELAKVLLTRYIEWKMT